MATTAPGEPPSVAPARPASPRPDSVARRPLLIVPGLHDSGPGHWQQIWLDTLPGAIKVEQADWSRPTLGEWVFELTAAIRRHPGAILIGHSLGCAVIAHVARLPSARSVSGAFLAAPAEVNRSGPVADLLAGFGPMPLDRFLFPAVVVASRTDPHVSVDRSRAFATAWGADFVDAGDAGHINISSGHGSWPEGIEMLGSLLDKAGPMPASRPAE